MKVIESASNPAVKRLHQLRRRRVRVAQGAFLIEGTPETRRAIESGIQITELYVLGEPPADVAAVVDEVVVLKGPAAARAAIRERGAGVIAIGQTPPMTLDELPTDCALVVIAESIEKPGNLGAMLRTADAAGVDAFVVCDPTVEPLNPNVIRASLGTVFTVPLAVADVEDTVAWCAAGSLTLVGLDPAGPDSLYEEDLTHPVALAVGSEHDGLSGALREAAVRLVAVPMSGTVDSLNAATALAVGVFEAVRQRH